MYNFVVALSELRDYIYVQRRRLFWRYLFNRRINFSQINLDFFRTHASLDLGIDYKGNRRTLHKFPKLSDIVQFYNRVRPLSIYVSTYRIEEISPFLEYISEKFSGIVIIDPLDQSISERPSWLPKNAIWCAPHIQNINSSDGVCIPVGVTNAWMWQYGRESLFEYSATKSRLVLSGPYGLTHFSRKVLNSYLAPLPFIDCLDKRLSPRKYSRSASKYAFILCPRGNGIDTHRFWESLYRGSIPIVERSEWSSHFRTLGIPLLAVDSFVDLQHYGISDLWTFYHTQLNELKTGQLLDPYFWLRKLESLTINHLQSSGIAGYDLNVFKANRR